MRFTHTAEQADFARTLESLLSGADTVTAARAWAAGDHAPGLALWSKLADTGVTALLVPERADGLAASPVELVIAMEAIGRHCVPGPWVETLAFLTPLLSSVGSADDTLAEVAAGEVLLTVAAGPHVPHALDADVASAFRLLDSRTLHTARVGAALSSIDTTRRLFTVVPDREIAEVPTDAVLAAFDLAVLANAAQLLGAGERVLADSVAYVKQRKQFGREIGSYQAIKHQLADVRIALDFARPLIDGAALTPGTIDVSAARIAAADAAHLASRVGLQVHGAIGYTAEFDLSLWILKIRALVAAWGTQSFHRARVLQALGAA
ncbi:acyl-CoA dehydrogenase domain-containing [Nocardioides sp. CF8]|uniref:acyl-CoA dehydrogenase family protein n=1 Tax=Nocardioides sp. CF8 TaxID=110319 RepID=UPI00033006D5|nr:acyl-CoA dehydrogenase family protein [Nocardioides sp. CF8]EON23786.1 acyl-CoA dehydrogenase domain-containing [Nocardioides sp. CF8]